mmetsp:Transcript_42502/g.131253  ORF Transcript_42502/g.131253 Transcript_42502/m.131253 type:complete len:247 (-) Transcript_42502:188-928(-)
MTLPSASTMTSGSTSVAGSETSDEESSEPVGVDGRWIASAGGSGSSGAWGRAATAAVPWRTCWLEGVVQDITARLVSTGDGPASSGTRSLTPAAEAAAVVETCGLEDSVQGITTRLVLARRRATGVWEKRRVKNGRMSDAQRTTATAARQMAAAKATAKRIATALVTHGAVQLATSHSDAPSPAAWFAKWVGPATTMAVPAPTAPATIAVRLALCAPVAGGGPLPGSPGGAVGSRRCCFFFPMAAT